MPVTRGDLTGPGQVTGQGPHFLLLTSQRVIYCFIITLSLNAATLLENYQIPILKSILMIAI